MSQMPSLSAITPLSSPGFQPTTTSSEFKTGSVPESLRERHEVAGQFEGAFVSMLLKELRSTLDGGLFGEESSDTYGAMFDMYLGQHLADSDALGIRNLLMNQWNRHSTAEHSINGDLWSELPLQIEETE